MKYDQLKELSEQQFRKLTRVKKATLKRMLEILREADIKKKAKGLRKSKLSIEDQVLNALSHGNKLWDKRECSLQDYTLD